MRSRSLGVIFIAAVIVPSILLAVLSIRSAGREEAYIQRQMAATLDAEVTHAAGLAGAEVGRVIDDLRAALDVPPGADYRKVLTTWKRATSLVAVPFMLSPRFGILWPPSDARADSDQKKFLQENGTFLSDRTTTTVLQNIAVRYQNEILADSTVAGDNKTAPPPTPSKDAPQSLPRELVKAQRQGAPKAAQGAAAPQASAESQRSQSPMDNETAAATVPLRRAESAPPAPAAPSARQKAIDTFAQNPAVQTRVYEEAREKGDQLNARVVEPMALDGQLSGPAAASSVTADANTTESSAAAPAAAAGESDLTTADALTAGAGNVPAAGKDRSFKEMTDQGRLKDKNLAAAPPPQAPSTASPPRDEAATPAPTLKKSATPAAAPAKETPSQFVLTSQLLSQIASRGDSGLIPRFIGEKLVFLFWERQRDGRIAGCEIASGAFRDRIAGVLTSTWSPVRILTLLDENGAPLATPPDSAGRDWRRPFVAREIGESLPRWEAAAYLTKPDSISAQARSSSLLIWIMVMILFVSVAGGGTMVLSTVYGEMRLAQQKATFVTNVSHELKTPLTSIGLFVDLLRRKGPLAPAKKEQYLSLMASETERLTRLINNVLDFSRDRTARRYSIRTVDAVEVAAQIVESQRVRLESRGFRVSLQTVPSGEPGTGGVAAVRADPEALKQVLLNLLSNAEKYSAEKKQITVIVSRGPSSILIRVCDRGIGIPERERERVFQEFYRVDDSLSSGVQGTGLGLTIARRIARDHGGDITCAPRDGGGTEFIVRLPAADGGEASE